MNFGGIWWTLEKFGEIWWNLEKFGKIWRNCRFFENFAILLNCSSFFFIFFSSLFSWKFSIVLKSEIHKNELLMTFWVPRRPLVPQKQHMLRFGSLCDSLEQEPKIMILSYLGLWAFWCQKSNLSFKMRFFGLKSIKIVSFDQKLHFVQKNCLKSALGRVYEKFNFGFQAGKKQKMPKMPKTAKIKFFVNSS